jgi:proteasome lid subunit RPN8/RPN11
MEAITIHAEAGYPHEICGFLIGAAESDLVEESRRARNIAVASGDHGPHDRYLIDPLDQIRVDRECDAQGKAILGFYHSHPNSPARASITDANAAWPDSFYLIVSVREGKLVDANVFVTQTYGGPMGPEPLEIVKG